MSLYGVYYVSPKGNPNICTRLFLRPEWADRLVDLLYSRGYRYAGTVPAVLEPEQN